MPAAWVAEPWNPTLVICTIGEILPSPSYWELVWVEDAAVNKSEGNFSAFPEPGKSRALMEQQISKSPLICLSPTQMFIPFL